MSHCCPPVLLKFDSTLVTKCPGQKPSPMTKAAALPHPSPPSTTNVTSQHLAPGNSCCAQQRMSPGSQDSVYLRPDDSANYPSPDDSDEGAASSQTPTTVTDKLCSYPSGPGNQHVQLVHSGPRVCKAVRAMHESVPSRRQGNPKPFAISQPPSSPFLPSPPTPVSLCSPILPSLPGLISPSTIPLPPGLNSPLSSPHPSSPPPSLSSFLPTQLVSLLPLPLPDSSLPPSLSLPPFLFLFSLSPPGGGKKVREFVL